MSHILPIGRMCDKTIFPPAGKCDCFQLRGAAQIAGEMRDQAGEIAGLVEEHRRYWE